MSIGIQLVITTNITYLMSHSLVIDMTKKVTIDVHDQFFFDMMSDVTTGSSNLSLEKKLGNNIFFDP
jgi:hypothetical protein